MTQTLIPSKPRYLPAVGPLGDVKRVFLRLGGLSRLDVVLSMVGVACVAFWSCMTIGKRKVASLAHRPTVYLLTYIPSPEARSTEIA